MTAFTGVDSQNLPDVMVSVQFILAIGEKITIAKKQRHIGLIIGAKKQTKHTNLVLDDYSTE
ncbi:hypothetical protein LOB44_09805 [Lactobacillus delbrueckii subsp. lactis]|uniref:hypothetical protein n=1 Tax=Lactobacillus delbrueckii TaxID=1584 RepID=UPI001E4797C5|nr:hypothetical protein [Lactobacillus delbrueckii]MCD5514887.1 hypothetical protein [Lactobacillus delbrueckii subsp. lactis]